jgi:hypothetical protein
VSKNKEEKQMEGSVGLAIPRTEMGDRAGDEVLEPGTAEHENAAAAVGPAAVFWEAVADQPPLNAAMEAERAAFVEDTYGRIDQE